MPMAWAQCICAKLGGFAIIASATNGMFVDGSGSKHDFQHPSSISDIIFRFFAISPARIDSNFGIMPGFFTIYFNMLSATAR